MISDNAARQRAFVERKKAGLNPERRLSVWVPASSFERFEALARQHGGRTAALIWLIESALEKA